MELLIIFVAMPLLFILALALREYRLHLWRQSSPSYHMQKMTDEMVQNIDWTKIGRKKDE